MPGELPPSVAHRDKLTDQHTGAKRLREVRQCKLSSTIKGNIADEKEHKIRATMIAALKEKFGHLGLTYSIGGQISFDVFPTGQQSLSFPLPKN